MTARFYRYLKNKIRKVNTLRNPHKIGGDTQLEGTFVAEQVMIGKGGKIMNSILRKNTKIGDNCVVKESELTGKVTVESNCKLYHCHLHGKISIGRYTSLWGPNLDIKTGKENVTIGNFCSIARNVYMQTFNHNSQRLSSYYIGKNIFGEKWEGERVSKGDIHIGHDVWIGAHAIILGGVTIGNGAVIAANTVVTKKVPPFAIIAGVPGKVIRYRFEPDIIARIEEMKWWDWPLEKIVENKMLFKDDIASIAQLQPQNE